MYIFSHAASKFPIIFHELTSTCLFVCFRSVTTFVPFVTAGPRLSLCYLFPCTFVIDPAACTYPPMSACPVHISYPSLPSRRTHIIKPHEYQPLRLIKPHILTVLLYYFQLKYRNSVTPKHLPSCILHVYLFQRP